MVRQRTREVNIGPLTIGGNHPVAVQTMWDRPVEDAAAVVTELNSLAAIGCDLVRFSVEHEDALIPLGYIHEHASIPVVADIHFNYRHALAALKLGIPKIRINPGNIGAEWKVVEVIEAARAAGSAIRIGINGGSLPRAYKQAEDRAAAMIEVIDGYIELFERHRFDQLVVSLKDSDPLTCYEVNRRFASAYDIPLHLGVTEAGPLIPAVTKSAFALGKLLEEGIGDTLRISITGDIRSEVIAGKELLKAVGRYSGGVRIISCPRCGRAGFNTHDFIESISERLEQIPESVSIAVMGCAVNGPGEASHADLGITGYGNEVVIFSHGEISARVSAEEAERRFFEELEAILNEKDHH